MNEPAHGLIEARRQCPLLGVKQTSQIRAVMSAYDPKRTSTCLFCRDAVHGCRSTFVLHSQEGGSRLGE
jgi:hypothetical protein